MDEARLILGHTAMGLTEIALPLVVMALVAVVESGRPAVDKR